MRAIKSITLFLMIFIYPTMSFCQDGSGKYCVNAEPLCGSSLFSYLNTSGFNQAEDGPDYGCLYLAINPAWFYFQIDQPGDIQLQIEQSSILGNPPDLDVDFILYGPFKDPRLPCISDLKAKNIVDCSFEIDVVEFVDITNTRSGDYYLLMIANFSLDPGYITVTQTKGAATTNCNLLKDPIVSTPVACYGDVITLDVSTDQSLNFVWYKADGNGEFVKIDGHVSSFLEVSNSGMYMVEVLNTTNVFIEHYLFNVTFLDNMPLQINAEVISNVFREENDIEVTVFNDPNDTYEYRIDSGAWQEDTLFKNVSLGKHEIGVINSTGCRMGYVTITVMDYPLYFTPNGDGYHDTWNIAGMHNQQDARIYIFDRYGKLLKQLIPNGLGWDGTYNGTKMPTSDYWFTVTYLEPKDGTLKEFKSHFTLKR